MISVGNQASIRQVKFGMLSARDTPSTAANSRLVAVVRRRAKWPESG